MDIAQLNVVRGSVMQETVRAAQLERDSCPCFGCSRLTTDGDVVDQISRVRTRRAGRPRFRSR